MKKGINNPGFRALPSSVQNNIISNMKYGGRKYNNGGGMRQLTEFNEGGRHEENGLGGIPQGMNPSGQMNLVEEGETKFDAENYIFSDTLKIDKELAKAFNLSPKMVGKTFADASKIAGRKKSKREGDAIETAANEANLMNLMEAQEAFKQKEVAEKLEEINELDPNALPALMGQGQPQGDPAMGGQMQEASMMDQEAMMAQQNQPSPEEMAMMQEQMMGQQEGMMRSGGKIPKSVLLSRAKSHMSDAAAQEYVKNYGSGGKFTSNSGTWPWNKEEEPGFIGPLNEDETQMMKAYKNHQKLLNQIDLSTDGTAFGSAEDIKKNEQARRNYLVSGFPLTGEALSLDTYQKWWDSPYTREWSRPPEAEKLGGYLGDGKSSFGGGGYMTRSYQPGGFMGMNMANAGMMNTGAMGTMGTSGALTGCLCMDGTTNPQCCGEGYDATNPGVRPKREARIENSFWDYENVDRKGDPVLRKGEGDFQGSFGRFTRNRRLPGRHRRTLQKYDVNYSQTNPGTARGMKDNPAMMTNTPPNMPANFANIDLSKYTPEQQEIIKSKSKLLSMDGGEYSFEEMYPGLLSKQDKKQIGKVRKALNWEPQQIPLGYDVEKKDRPPKDPTGKYSDSFYDKNQKRIEEGKLPKTLDFDRDVFGWIRTRLDPRLEKMEYFPKAVRQRGPFKGSNKWIWREGKGNPKIKGMQFGGNLLGGGLAQQGFNLNQGLGSQMRRGGKLCYGCGGKMHAYGGRIDGIAPNQAKYGKWLDFASNTLGTAASVIGNVPVIGTAIGAGLGTLSGITGSLADNARASDDGKVDWKGVDYGDMALQAGMGAGAGALGTVGSTLTNLGGQGVDALTTSKYETQEAAHQDIINNPDKYSIEEYEAALAKEEERGKNSALFNIANQAIGIGGQIASGKIKKGLPEKTVEEVTDSAIDAIPVESMGDMEIIEPAFSRYGRKLYGGGGYMGPNYFKSGGGLWANIRAKKERMGKNYRPAQPGDPDRPDQKSWEKAQKQMGGSLNQYTTDNTFDNGGKLTLVKQIQQPDGTTVQKSVTYSSLQELLADKEMVMKYGGPENVKELFAARFKDANVPYQATLMDNTIPPAAVVSGGNQEMMQEEAQMQMNPMAERLNYMQQSLQVNPEDLAELEAVKNLERAVDTENPVFTPDPRFTKDSNQNDIPDYLEKSGDFEEEIEDTEEKEERIEEIKTKTEKQDDEIPVDTDLSDAKFDFEYKESFPQFAAKIAGPLYNIGAGLFSKPKDYNPDFIPLDVPKFDPTQALSNVKRQVSGLRRQLNKVGANPSNLLALAQSGSRLENETLMTYDKLQKELDFRGEQYNKGQKQQLEKYKKQLEMSFDEAKRKSIQEGIKQFSEMQQTEAANYLAAQYNAMAAPNLGTFSYTPFLQKIFNKNNKKKKDK